MIINQKLFKDLFIESHKQLAIKSLQTLNNSKNLLIFKSKDKLTIEKLNIISVVESKYFRMPDLSCCDDIVVRYNIRKYDDELYFIYEDKFFNELIHSKNYYREYVEVTFCI